MNSTALNRDVDVDVRGLLTIRLLGARASDIASVERQLGLVAVEPAADDEVLPAMTLRYHDRLPMRTSRRRSIGSPDVMWTDDGVTLSRGQGAGGWVYVPFDQLGDRIVLDCERGIGTIPLLVPLLNLCMLGQGVIPLHASAFTYRGLGIAAAGWSKGGKTEVLLAAMADGAQMVADEWAYLTADGFVHGLPTRIRLEPWHVRAGWKPPVGRSNVGPRMQRVEIVDRGLSLAVKTTAPVRRGRLIARVLQGLASRNHLDLAPADAFGADACVSSLALERLYWLVPFEPGKRAHGEVSVSDVDAGEVARRMAIAHVHHRLAFLDAYWRFRYAFPERTSAVVEQMEERERTLLDRALRGVRTMRLDHPRGGRLDALADAIRHTLPR